MQIWLALSLDCYTKFYGPYKVIQRIGLVAYKLELPKDACIHPVFYVSFLKLKLGEAITPISRLPPMDAIGTLSSSTSQDPRDKDHQEDEASCSDKGACSMGRRRPR